MSNDLITLFVRAIVAIVLALILLKLAYVLIDALA